MPNLVVRACQQADIDCQQPVIEVGPADAQGWLDIPITDGFRGYFQITSPTVLPTALFHSRLLPTTAA